ncbi:MAG: glutamine synthetase family protein [Pelagimonas sp.]|jgi:glutamine synthetase|nr:glutamine synthetase family protein [Pelagimonas sp.]
MPGASAQWLTDNPQIHSVRTLACDLNGIARGKRLPLSSAGKIVQSGARMPVSALNLDIWGEDIEDSPLVFESGDADAALLPTERGFVPMPWLGDGAALLPMWMYHEDGSAFDGDPRHALNAVVQRYRAQGLTPVVAMEMEFYLVDDSGDSLQAPLCPRTGKRRTTTDILSVDALDAYDAFFTDLYDACAVMEIPADAAISEGGQGQFEINLLHQNDPLRAADDAWFFKLLVRGMARKHGFAATFMAKPYGDQAGSGMHTHFSVLDDQGRNIFDDGSDQGSDRLGHAVAGCVAALADSTLIYAPHANSFARMVPGAHAPTGVCWAYENRTSAIRIPGGAPAARRIEHRVAGGDVNPYLSLAAILGAALNGLDDRAQPPDPIQGNAYDLDLPQVATDWDSAIARFDTSPLVARIFTPELIRNLTLTKRQELRKMASLEAQAQTQIYLETV